MSIKDHARSHLEENPLLTLKASSKHIWRWGPLPTQICATLTLLREGPVFALRQAGGEEGFLGTNFGKLDSAAKVTGGSGKVFELGLEFAEDSVEEVVRFQGLAIADGGNGVDACLGPVDLGNGHGTVQAYDGRVVDLDELIVERKDARPIGGLVIGRRAVAGGNAGLKVILADFVPGRRLAELDDSAGDHGAVPERTVLILKAKDISVGIGAGAKTRGVQEHEGKQSVRARQVGRRMLGNQRGQADGFGTEFFADEIFTAGSFVALVEKEVDSLEDGIEPGREFFTAGNFERDAKLADALLGASEALGDGGLGGKESFRNFGRAETAKGFEGERRLGFKRDGRMATREDEAKFAVLDFVFELGRFGIRIGRPVFKRGDNLSFLVAVEFFAADVVESEVLGGLGEPGGGIFWDANVGPGAKGFSEGFLDDVFSKIEAIDAEDAGEDGDQLGKLVAEEVIRQLRDIRSWRRIGNDFWRGHGRCAQVRSAGAKTGLCHRVGD